MSAYICERCERPHLPDFACCQLSPRPLSGDTAPPTAPHETCQHGYPRRLHSPSEWENCRRERERDAASPPPRTEPTTPGESGIMHSLPVEQRDAYRRVVPDSPAATGSPAGEEVEARIARIEKRQQGGDVAAWEYANDAAWLLNLLRDSRSQLSKVEAELGEARRVLGGTNETAAALARQLLSKHEQLDQARASWDSLKAVRGVACDRVATLPPEYLEVRQAVEALEAAIVKVAP